MKFLATPLITSEKKYEGFGGRPLLVGGLGPGPPLNQALLLQVTRLCGFESATLYAVHDPPLSFSSDAAADGDDDDDDDAIILQRMHCSLLITSSVHLSAL